MSVVARLVINVYIVEVVIGIAICVTKIEVNVFIRECMNYLEMTK
jgi:hypothetical protein